MAHIPEDIFRTVRARIRQVGTEHHADLVFRIDLMSQLGSLGTGDHLVVNALVLGFQEVVNLVGSNA